MPIYFNYEECRINVIILFICLFMILGDGAPYAPALCN